MNFFTYIADLPTAPSGLPGGPSNLQAAINNLFTFALWAIGVVAVIMIIYAGFMYIISAGRPDRTKLALQSLIYTAVGFGIVILARSIVEAILPVVKDQPNIQSVVTGGISFFMWVVGVAATIMVIISGLFYVTSGGDPGRTKTAKDTLLYAVIGLGIAVLAGGLITFVQSALQP
ncbi:MAG: hypothetical protein U0526_02980 [Candidatus Saccharibacteria bacterium]|jgi:hypothetical protein